MSQNGYGAEKVERMCLCLRHAIHDTSPRPKSPDSKKSNCRKRERFKPAAFPNRLRRVGVRTRNLSKWPTWRIGPSKGPLGKKGTVKFGLKESVTACDTDFMTRTRDQSLPTPKSRIAKKNLVHFSICACHPCAGAMLIFSVSFQF